MRDLVCRGLLELTVQFSIQLSQRLVLRQGRSGTLLRTILLLTVIIPCGSAAARAISLLLPRLNSTKCSIQQMCCIYVEHRLGGYLLVASTL